MKKKLNSVDILQHEVQKLKHRFKILTLILVLFVVANVIFIIFLQYSDLRARTNAQDSQPTQLAITPPIKKDYNVSITSFYNNSAVSEVGYQLELKKQSISTRNTTNCYTDEAPPIINGCGFIVRPFASGIPTQGTYLHRMTFASQMGSSDQIAIDIRDNEKNEIVSSVGVIQGKDSTYSVKLPSNLKTNEQVLVRLWPKRGSEVTVTEVLIEYFDITKLQETKLVIADDLKTKYLGKKMSIYLDSDKNGLFDPEIDLLWKCIDGFPGVKPVIVDGKSPISLIRADECVQKNNPTSWKTDKGILSLPVYHWLAIVGLDDNKSDIYPFETSNGVTEYELK
jgi:hypothetical protein